MPRVRYEVDPHNRLIIKTTGRKSGVPGFRHALDGRFRIAKKNTLSYHVKRSRCSDVPQQIKFRGKWSLDKDHNLVLTLNKWNNQIAGNKLVIKGRILDVKRNSLLFSVTTKTPRGSKRIDVLSLTGSFCADKNNTLTFNAARERGGSDIITLKGVWEISKKGKLVYKYTKRKKTYLLTFEGRWDASDKFRVSYVIGKHAITIAGRWRVDMKKGFIFEVRYKNRKPHTIVFGGTIKLAGGNNLEIKLRNQRNKDLGVTLMLSKRFFKGCGESFLKALGSRKEITLTIGTGFIW